MSTIGFYTIYFQKVEPHAYLNSMISKELACYNLYPFPADPQYEATCSLIPSNPND